MPLDACGELFTSISNRTLIHRLPNNVEFFNGPAAAQWTGDHGAEEHRHIRADDNAHGVVIAPTTPPPRSPTSLPPV